MLKKTLTFLLILAAAAAFTTSPAIAADTTSLSTGTTGTRISEKGTELQLAVRDLLTTQTFLVRSVVYATANEDNAAVEAAEDNVLQNAIEIGNGMALYYGQEKGDQLFNLIVAHFTATKEYLIASIVNEESEKNSALENLENNANEMAVFLNSVNSMYWPIEMLVPILMAHGQDHIAQIDAVIAKDYEREAGAMRAMKAHTNVLADMLAGGIQSQFPEKF